MALTDATAALGVELRQTAVAVLAARTVLLVAHVALARLEQHALRHQTRALRLVARRR